MTADNRIESIVSGVPAAFAAAFRCLALAAIGFWLAVAPATAAERTELVMIEEIGCIWCETWNAEIGPIYPKTAEARTAPLRRVDFRNPEDMATVEPARPVNFTPTFLLVEDGRELARIEGYPGEDFFWGLLGVMLRRHTGFDTGS